MAQRIEFFFLRCIKGIILLLPLKSVQRFGEFLGTVCYFLVWKRREIALDNLAQAFPDKTLAERKKITMGAFRSYAVSILEFLWFPNLTKESLRKIVTIDHPEVFADCYNRGKGAIALSAHFGNWELNALAVALAGGYPTSIIVQTQSNTAVDAIINSHRTMFGSKVVPMGISVREIIRALQKSEVVALAADQSGPMEGPYIDFFGRKTAGHQGPAVFALKMGSPMFLSLSRRNPDGTYLSHMEEIPTRDLVGGATEENILTLTQRHTTILENYIRQFPDQWLWLHRRWKHTLDNDGRLLTNGVRSDA